MKGPKKFLGGHGPLGPPLEIPLPSECVCKSKCHDTTFLLFLIHFHLPNVITRSHCSLLNHISSFARFILVSMLTCVITSLSFIFHLLLGLDYILTNVFLHIFSHTPFLFFLFLIG